jgi:hypothetical protein
MRKWIVYSFLLYLSFASCLWAQAFQNLDFESANVSNLPSGQFEFVPVADGLPSWTAYVGTNELTQVSHNLISLGGCQRRHFGACLHVSAPSRNLHSNSSIRGFRRPGRTASKHCADGFDPRMGEVRPIPSVVGLHE